MEYSIEGSLFDYEPDIKPEFDSPVVRFKELLARPEDDIDLAEAALLIASIEYPGLSWGYYLERLDAMGDDVRLLRAGESDPLTSINTLNSYLYNTLGFKGNQTDYDDPRNFYLNDVIERRTGTPITLSLVYMEVAKRAGLPIEGIGLPGHFIVRYREHASQTTNRLNRLEGFASGSDEQILLDPFNEGAILTEEDCLRLVTEVMRRPVPLTPYLLRPVTKTQFLTRLLNNLRDRYIVLEDYKRALQYQEFIIAMHPEDWSEIRDRGILYSRIGRNWKAIHDLQTYVRRNPRASDVSQVQNFINKLMKEIASRN